MRYVLLLTMLFVSRAGIAGPISKWDSREPDGVFDTAKNINDIERCLIDLNGVGGIPYVYKQPDQPNKRMLVWQNEDVDTTARIDLEQMPKGTRAVVWKAIKKNSSATRACLGL